MRKTRRGGDRHGYKTSDGMTITSGAAVPQIDLARLFDRPRTDPAPGDSLAGAAAAASPVRTVSLSDGSKIVFAAAASLDELESA